MSCQLPPQILLPLLYPIPLPSRLATDLITMSRVMRTNEAVWEEEHPDFKRWLKAQNLLDDKSKRQLKRPAPSASA